MQERDRTHGAGNGDEDIVDDDDGDEDSKGEDDVDDYEICASGTGRDVEDDNSEHADDHYDDGDGDGDDGDDGDVGVNERDNVDKDEMCKSKREQAALAKMRKIMIFSMMLNKVRMILRQRSNRLRMIMILLVLIISPKTVRTR